MSLTAVVAERWDDADEAVREWAVARLGKDGAAEWDRAAEYGVVCPGDDGEDIVTVSVDVGRAGDVWYVRTSDDAGGGDDYPDRPYPTEQEAIDAALAFAAQHDQTPDLDELVARIRDARGWSDATARRVVAEIASVPEHSGMWLDVFPSGATSLVSDNVYRYDPDVRFESYRGADSAASAALKLLAD